jgi:PAS domain S-box-containing protein
MKIQLKFIILFAAVLIAVNAFVALYTLFQRSSMISFFKADQAQLQANFDALIKLKAQSLENTAKDYTFWDEMVAFVSTADMKWAVMNLDPMLETFNIDSVWIYSVDGKLVYNKNSYNDDRLRDLLIGPHSIDQIFAKGPFCSFFVRTGVGLIQVYGSTIQPTSDQARKTPAKGYFFVSKVFSPSYLKELSDLSGGSVSILDPGTKVPQRFFETNFNKGRLVIRKTISDPWNIPVGQLEMKHESKIIADFNKNIARNLLGLLAFGIILVCTSFLFVFIWINRPLQVIAESLKKEDSALLRTLKTRPDEFGAIADLIEKFFSQREQFVREINARNMAEAKISRAAREWRATFDSINDQISVMDKNFNIVRVNTTFSDRFGMRPDEIIGKICFELLGRSKPCPRCPHINALQTKSVAVSEYFISSENRYREVTCTPIYDEKADVIGSIHIVKDVTSRKDLEKKQRLAQLGKLVADMAHEVNNPLMIISGRSQLSLMEEINNQEVKDNLKIIIDECQRAKEIIQRLLRFARPMPVETRKIDIHASLDAVINLLEHQYSLSGVTFIRSYDNTTPLVTVDDRQMQEVFMNLFNNAREAMPGGGTITIRTFLKDNFCVLEIRDTGAGMSTEVKQRLFEPFFTTKEKGTGLGLSVCYGILRSYGGSLRFESEIPKGTIAVITLPVSEVFV